MGNYVHGNEPSHHVAYLFNWTSEPWRTQEKVRRIFPRMYKPATDGLSGNDDCGQMSAWYIFSALGFYPVAPASGAYAIGSPLVKEAIIKLAGNKKLVIEAKEQSELNIYLQQVLLNGKRLTKPTLKHSDLMKGGKLSFLMGPKPNPNCFTEEMNDE